MKDMEEGESRTIEGYAALFDTRSKNLGWFEEVIERGAFDGALPKSDVRALINHDVNLLIGRTKVGTARVFVDERGLRYEADLPNTTYANDLIESIKRGDIDQSSFAFTVKRQSWEEEKREDGSIVEIRHIHEVEELFDVSPVTYPAYTDTTVAKRSYNASREQRTNDNGQLAYELRERKLRLLELT